MSLSQGDGLYTNSPLLLEDTNGDLIYSGSLMLNPPTTFDVTYRINYSSSTGAIIQNGGGFQKGRNYYQYIRPTVVHTDGSIEWPSEFSFPVLLWLNSDLTVEDPPDLWTPTGVLSNQDASIKTFELAQSYPNPFNPETTIRYQVAEKSHVQICVYNIMGQLVATLVNEQKPQGAFLVRWNGKDYQGNDASSGMYLVKMIAGSFERSQKMMLIR